MHNGKSYSNSLSFRSVRAEGIFEGGRARNLLANWANGDTMYVIAMIHRCQHKRNYASSPTDTLRWLHGNNYSSIGSVAVVVLLAD